MVKRSRLVLAWGGGGGNDILPSIPTKKRNSPTSTSNNDLWTIQYAPKHISDICVAPKKRKQVEDFLNSSSSSGGSSSSCCCILTGNPGIGKSTMISLLLGKDRIYEWTEEANTANALESFCQFLQQVPYIQNQDAVVVIDEVPYLHTTFQKERFAQAMMNLLEFCSTTGNPQKKVIWIQTSSSSSDSYTSLLPSHITNSILIIPINPVTKPKMLKVINPILRQHQLPPLQSDDVSIYQGDLRQALLSLQFQSYDATTTTKKSKKARSQGSSSSNNNNNTTVHSRDITLSPFHAMGRLLYAKRRTSDEKLEYIPEQVMSSSASNMSLVSTMYFLQGHGPHFFPEENIDQLHNALQYFSDAATLMDHSYQQQNGHDALLHPYATSLASRAVATTNRFRSSTTSGGGKFRSFTAPSIWEVNRQAKYNRKQLEPLAVGVGSSAAGFSNFVTHVYPYLRNIAPSATLADLQSHIIAKTNPQQQQKGNSTNNNGGESLMEQQRREEREKEQEEILRMDDIDEFSD